MNLDKISTKDKDGTPNGWILLIYKKTDEIFREYEIKFIYASSIAPKSRKGPHMHLKRECRLIPITGKVKVTIKKNGLYESLEIDSLKPSVLIIKTGTPFTVQNDSEDPAILLNLANHIWEENDQDSHAVLDW